jgi:hypothetical protein
MARRASRLLLYGDYTKSSMHITISVKQESAHVAIFVKQVSIEIILSLSERWSGLKKGALNLFYFYN